MNTKPLVVERTYNAPITAVWKALTDSEGMKRWSFDVSAFKPEVGFEFRFMGGKDGRQYLHICKVTEVIAGKKLRYSWRYDGYEGISYVTFELFEQGRQTRLKLTHEGLESFPSGNPDFAKENFLEGWTSIVGKGLKDLVEGTAG